MPARKVLEGLVYDPATFDFEQFKAKMLAELTEDEGLTAAKVDTLTRTNTAFASENQGLKSRLWDATVMKQGAPVAPGDAPTAPAGNDTAGVAVKDDEIFG